MRNLEAPIEALKPLFEGALNQLSRRLYPSESALDQALRYALEGRGKRVRPLLALATAKSFGTDPREALAPALSLEMIHTYSLIHDDLPCMDNDDLRRGRPTLHRAYNEATALLAGDALLTEAFGILGKSSTECPYPLSAETRLALINELCEAIGSQGMVRGQALDLYWTQRELGTKAELNEIHLLKTGKLLATSMVMGAIVAGASTEEIRLLKEIGAKTGLAFQIRDDLLDETEIGKTPGKDLEQGKLTYLKLMSPAEALNEAERLSFEAIDLLTNLGEKSKLLIPFIGYLLTRSN